VDYFNKFLSTVGDDLQEKLGPPLVSFERYKPVGRGSTLSDLSATTDDIVKAIQLLQPKTSSGLRRWYLQQADKALLSCPCSPTQTYF